jgi:hypothetical protein
MFMYLTFPSDSWVEKVPVVVLPSLYCPLAYACIVKHVSRLDLRVGCWSFVYRRVQIHIVPPGVPSTGSRLRFSKQPSLQNLTRASSYCDARVCMFNYGSAAHHRHLRLFGKV